VGLRVDAETVGLRQLEVLPCIALEKLLAGYWRSGLQGVRSEQRDLFTRTRTVRVELKSAGDASTTVNGRKILGVGVGAPGRGILGLQNALPSRGTVGTTAAEYSRYTGQQGVAAVQAAEGDAKAAVRPDHTLIQQAAITIAGHTKIRGGGVQGGVGPTRTEQACRSSQ
jgi:hypothetical protein